MEPIMGIDEVLKLVESLQDTDVQEVEIADGDRKIRIVRMTPGTFRQRARSYQHRTAIMHHRGYETDESHPGGNERTSYGNSCRRRSARRVWPTVVSD